MVISRSNITNYAIDAELVVSNSIQGNKIGAICGQPCHRTNRQQRFEGY